MNILIVPDAHANPDTNNNRFNYLGNFILEKRPDIIVNLGDLSDLNSLSSYDKGKKSFEGRRYRNDVACTIDALEKIDAPFKLFNETRKNIKKAQISYPRKIITLGNHEKRVDRAIENSPELEGVMSINDLKYREFGYEVYPFRIPVNIEGIWFCHYFVSGVLGQAISGIGIASSLIQKNMASSICGHAHTYDYAIRSRPDGSKVIGLCAGWYGEEVTYEEATENLYWSGLTMLNDVHDGIFDIEQFSMERIKRNYG